MIYFCCTDSDQDTNNQWIVDNADPLGDNSFIINMQDSQENQYCLFSQPDNNSEYNQLLQGQFTWYDVDPRIFQVVLPTSASLNLNQSRGNLNNSNNAPSTDTLTDIIGN